MSITAAETNLRVGRSSLDVARVREDFPILSTLVHGKPLVYLDSAASSQKPRQVIDANARYYETSHANIHRGVHYLSERATALYDETREAVRRFVNARHAHEIIFTRGTTESVNLVASTFGVSVLKPGDEILLSTLEHHSNIVPWQLAAERAGARITVLPITDSGELVMEALPDLLSERTRIVAVTHVSNALGTVTPIQEIVRQAHAKGIPVLVDGAQAAPHIPVDVQALDCDFYVFSGHKMLGPTGAGVLYGKESWLERLPPYQGGGDMIVTVTMERSTYAPLPAKFEAGTPDIAAVVAFRSAIEYLESLGLQAIAEHEHDLLAHATERLRELDGVRIVGEAAAKAGVLSFTMRGVHAHDIATILDSEGVAIRAGHHCAQPVMRRLNVDATARASFYLYNTHDEIETLVRGLHKVREVFG
jgi:cysteine desulfurase / selenocysteine lyase